MRCPLCEPHGLGMGLELLLCVPSALRRTHTARTAPYGTVAGWVAERRALIDVVVLDVVRTWIRPVPERSTVVMLLQPVRVPPGIGV
jgi:hypothetical protein